MIAAKIEITPKQIADLMVSAIEGGCNYWCAAVRPKKAAKATTAEEKGWPWYSRASFYDGNFKIVVEEQEESVEGQSTEHTVGPAEIAKSIAIIAEKFPHHLGDVFGDHDATTGDVFIQCAALGDIVYG